MKFDDPRLPGRFWSKCLPEPMTGCWLWHGARNGEYGVLQVNKTPKYAHVLAEAAAHGLVPNGYQVDHLCRQRACVNPEHLEAVTPAENLRRACGWHGNVNRVKTHCPAGHEYNEANTYRPKGTNSRMCYVCVLARGRKGCV